MSKGQGLSLNTIIIAVIAIVVLVVLVGLFTGVLGNFIDDLFGQSEKICTGANFESPKPSEIQGCSDGYKRLYGKFKEGELQPGEICCQLVDLPDPPSCNDNDYDVVWNSCGAFNPETEESCNADQRLQTEEAEGCPPKYNCVFQNCCTTGTCQ